MTDFTLQWMRPIWLWGFLPLAMGLLYWWRRRSRRNAWVSVVDVQLRPHVIDDQSSDSRFGAGLLFALWALALLLLAGPVWQQREVPVLEALRAEIIVFDLSNSMRATDVSPDRLTRAKFKLLDLLRRSNGQQTGLIAFAERPYVISPLTDDEANVEAFVSSLEPEIMPAQGSRPDLAIASAVELLEQARVANGHIILISDARVGERELEVARQLRAAGHSLSVLAVGSNEGIPLRGEDGQFLKYSDGSIVVPQLNFFAMRELAETGDGVAVRLSTTADDLDALDAVRQRMSVEADLRDKAASRIYWVEYSPWFLWVLVIAVLLGFRRGVVSS